MGQFLLDRAKWAFGWMSLEELSCLAEIANGLKENSIVFEIGSLCGRSTLAIAENSPKHCKIYCIDPWDYEIPAIGSERIVVDEATYKQFCVNLHDYIRAHKVKPVTIKWENFEVMNKADFIFIDGDHEYESVQRDILKALNHIKPGGIIAGHDYNWPGVKKAVDEIFSGISTRNTIWVKEIPHTPTKEKRMSTKVLVALVTGEYVRQASFLPSFLSLERPLNSLTSTVHGQSPAAARNTVIKQALDNNCTHIFFMDDDMVFPPDTLMKLISHDKPIVTGLYLLRAFPHRPAFFDQAYENGKCKFAPLTKGLTGLVKGVNAGLGAALISTEVFKKVEPPWVRLGEIDKDGWCDDVGFFNRCRAAGYDVWCDLNAPVGHMTTLTIWPEQLDGEWFTNYKHVSGNVRVTQDIPTLEQIKEQELALTK